MVLLEHENMQTKETNDFIPFKSYRLLVKEMSSIDKRYKRHAN